MAPTISCAYLRVYQPLDAFPPAVRERVERAVGVSATPRPAPHALGLIDPSERQEVFSKTHEGTLYVCPSQTRLRTLMSLVAVEKSLPKRASEVFFTPEEVRAAQRELEQLQEGPLDVTPFLVQSPWHVPVRWFVCFDDAERRLVHDGEYPCITYDTTLHDARERIGRALEILKGGSLHPVIVGMVYELNAWLQSFAEQGLLELDYASVARLFEPDELADDHSARDVWEAIEALGHGDGMRAGLFYQRVHERWAPKRGYESVN